MSFSEHVLPHTVSLVGLLRTHLENGLTGLQNLLSDLHPKSDPEIIHKIRVSTRRARALCGFLHLPDLAPEFQKLEKRLRRLTRGLSPIRSWDVSYQQLKALDGKYQKNHGQSLAVLKKIFRKQVKKIRKQRLKKLKPQKFKDALNPNALILPWEVFSEGMVQREMTGQVGQSSVRVLQSWKNFRKSQALPDLHQVRISLKKLRYLLEIHALCYDQPSKGVLKGYKALQDRLGHIHDLEVLNGHLREKAIRKKLPEDKKKIYRNLCHDLEDSISNEVICFQKREGSTLSSLIGEELP